MSPIFTLISPAVFGLILLALSGCKKSGASGPPDFPTQVIAVKAQREPVTERLSVVGTVRANETVDLKPETDGRITGIHFEEGQRVEAGQLLVELNSGATEAMLAEAEANQNLAQAKWERTQGLLETRSLSKQEGDEARASVDMTAARVSQIHEELRNLRITAPFGGIIGARHVSPGQVVAKTSIIATLSDLDPVKVEGNVPERFLSQTKVGQKIKLTIAAFPNETFEGEIYFISPQVDPGNRTGLVKAKVANGDLRLKPGMFASADVALKVTDDAVVIPEAALISQGEDFSVVVVTDQMTAEMRPVRPGVRMAGKVEIVKGLESGETVVVEGWQKTRPGGKVVLAPEEKAKPYAAK